MEKNDIDSSWVLIKYSEHLNSTLNLLLLLTMTTTSTFLLFHLIHWLHVANLVSFFSTSPVAAFHCQHQRRRLTIHSQQRDSDDISSSQQPSDCTTDPFLASLYARQEALEQGIGKRYVVRTMYGFLNVHSSYMDGPYATGNIVRSLKEGDIVTSTARNVTLGFPPEHWISHDQGGWSVAQFAGFTWLKEIQE